MKTPKSKKTFKEIVKGMYTSSNPKEWRRVHIWAYRDAFGAKLWEVIYRGGFGNAEGTTRGFNSYGEAKKWAQENLD